MKTILTLILSLFTITSWSQDIELKKDVVSVDGVELFKINGGDMGVSFSIENMKVEKLIFIQVDNDNKSANGTLP